MDGRRLLDDLRPRRDEMLAALIPLVEHESPSGDTAALDALARRLHDALEAIGGRAELIGGGDGPSRVRATFAGSDPAARPALVLCHFDTVWPVGTLATMPARVDAEDDRAYGPGIFDMKASLVIVEWALRAIRDLGLAPPRDVVVLLTPDEEIGSRGSRGLIEQEAARSAHVLVMEAPLAGGKLKTARKGVGAYTVTIRGRAAHAGVEPEKGVSAIQELAHQILAIHALADPSAGTTLNVGLVSGGTASNTVAGEATARVDVRVSSPEEAGRVEAAMRSLRPVMPGATLEVQGGLNRPPMVRTPAIGALFERARAIGRTLGLDLEEGSTGGGSDGNFTAALGVPTLDGLGALGAGAHAANEHIRISSLPERAALLAALLLGL